MKDPIYIDRPPRIQPELPFAQHDIPRPPTTNDNGFMQMLQMAIPLLTIIGFVFMSGMGGGGRGWIVIPMALSVVASVAFSLYSFRKEKQKQAAQKRAYQERLIELTKEMTAYHDQQRRFYRYNYPDCDSVERIVQNARIEVEKEPPSLRSESRLWERRVEDDDFGVVRLGMGTLASTVVYEVGEIEDMDDPLARAAKKIEEDSFFVDDIPIILSFRQPAADEGNTAQDESDKEKREADQARTPVTHALGIAGDKSAVYEFSRALLGHFVTFHAPMDARLYVLATRKDPWRWTDELPHSQGDEQTRYTCFVEGIDHERRDDGIDDGDGNELDQFLEGIRRILASRKIRLQDREENEDKGSANLPFLLVVVDLMDLTHDPDSLLHDLESDAAMTLLLAEGALLGAAVIFLVPTRSKVPSGCTAVIEAQRSVPNTNSQTVRGLEQLHFRYSEVGVNSFRYVGVADAITDPNRMDALIRRIAEVDVRQGFGANLAASVPFLDLMGYQSLTDLEEDAKKRWHFNSQKEKADWLRVRIGRMTGNKPRTLTFAANKDGVHGMVAGSTGSGKSELLISLIMGMAVNYDPSALNFVIVDFKGGAFNELKKLPHCVDVITNLGMDGVTRMFTAISAELNRRQALNAETKTQNIIDYRRKGLHRTHKPYPFLFIIIDEFAEVIAERPEYKSQLETITRLGRAQGVSLLLAAQRPSGVTDQMRSNIKYRICLRVETSTESREMLRRGDAAWLPSIPGRGFLQVGNDEIELIQVAYAGERYVDPAQRQAEPAVLWPDRRPPVAQDEEPPRLYEEIIRRLARLAEDEGIEAQRAPWPGFLPTQLALTQTLIADDPAAKPLTHADYILPEDRARIRLGAAETSILTLNPSLNRWLDGDAGWLDVLDWEKHAMRPVVGLVDNPYAAQQSPLIVDLPQGHLVLFGGAGWGKTTFLRTLVTSLAATHSPDHAHIYILDLGGRTLGSLSRLPHVGAVIFPDEEGFVERVEQLLREIEAIIDKRKEMGITDLYSYNQAHPQAALPAVLVAIDNFTVFKEAFDKNEDGVVSVMDKFIGLARESKNYGVHFVITADRLNTLSNQLFSIFAERLTLKLADDGEYRAIVGAPVYEAGNVRGRGYTRGVNKGEPVGLSFQVAQPLDLRRAEDEDPDAEPADERAELEALAQTMHDFIAHSGRRYTLPVRVNPLPKALYFKELLARQHRFDLDAAFARHLAEEAAAQWTRSTLASAADWLRVTLGVISGDRPRELYFQAKEDGVHGLIAGGTGSGKSELLMTLIIGLALRYDPSILNFVLVDYKGGGAFQAFYKNAQERLPHCVDLVTNLNKSAVRRMFTAITAEIERRQRLNKETQTNDIVEYRQRGYHLRLPDGSPGIAYPHLFIIIDEYAEMISDSPEFKTVLDTITRVGRAQGVNLLLAAQRPIGVTDQMRENIKYRICLRVEGVDTSREMLRRSDAAFLPSGMPGRGYLQVGNERIELIQVAYAGENYDFAEVNEQGRQPKFYEVAVDLTRDLAADNVPSAPWPPFLPAHLSLSTPLAEHYLDATESGILTLAQPSLSPMLNPFVTGWLRGENGWGHIDWRHTALRAVVGLVDDPYGARQLPLTVDFGHGHAVLFGASGAGKSSFLRALVTSLAATHSPAELHVHVLDLGGRNLNALRHLPHVGTLVTPDEGGYEEIVQQLLRELNAEVEQRKSVFSQANVTTLPEYNHAHPNAILPAMLVVIDNFAEFIESFRSDKAEEGDENNVFEAFVTLARQSRPYGVHFIITANRFNVLNSKLYSLFAERLTLHLTDAGDYSSIVGAFAGEIDEIPGRGLVRVGRRSLEFQAAVAAGDFAEDGQLSGEMQQIQAVGEQMHKLGAWTGKAPLRISALPTRADYSELLALPDVLNLDPSRNYLDALKAAMDERWTAARTAQKAGWLTVPVGKVFGNRPRVLKLAASEDGVHGLVAGGTGSGKSELLMTLIVGLALHYPPEILNFVLVDYKGGGAFKPFEDLPHCVDLVTNLGKAGVHRMFSAINAEMYRRQRLNVETGTNDIVEYRRKGYHLRRPDGSTGVPYPHLFIIIDEYAEMIDENPDYRAQLESITRVGRAQGVNLLLASQRPKGVTDQMRANIKLRLCLRVEETDTSFELLRRPDAAFLPNKQPGRGYLQVGNDNAELIQVAWSGHDQPDDRAVAVLWPERAARPTAPSQDSAPKFFNTAVMLANELTGNVAAPKPWPAFLPTKFSLQSPIEDAQQQHRYAVLDAVSDWLNGDWADLWPGVDWTSAAMTPVLGLMDVPSEARQVPLTFDLKRNHLAVFGDTGWGKTSFLRTLIVSLAATHSPDEAHIYVLDLGGRNFAALQSLPHVADVITADEEVYEERLLRLIDRLNLLVDSRQRLFAEKGVGNLWAYNALPDVQIQPAVTVIIDNMAELRTTHELLLESAIMPLIRRSLSAGITFVVSANTHTEIPGKIYNLFGERITFKQADPERYMDIVGRGAVQVDDVNGRGYVRHEGRPLQVQAALPVGIFDGADGGDPLAEADELRRLGAQMRRRGGWSMSPTPIATLPRLTPLRALLTQSAPTTSAVTAVLGRDHSLQPAHVDLRQMGPHFVITGPPLSGKTTALYNWVLSLAARYSPEQVMIVLVDLQGRLADYDGATSLRDLPHVVQTVTDENDLPALVAHLDAESAVLAALKQKRKLFVVIDNFDDLNEELISARSNEIRDAGAALVRIARRNGTMGVHFVAAGGFTSSGDLARVLRASNYGIALRNVDMLNTLNVSNIPGNLRDRELPVGRGFVAKSGQIHMIQVATPYQDDAYTDPDLTPDAREAQENAAMDKWIGQICAQWQPFPAAQWTDATVSIANGNIADKGNGAQSAESKQVRDLKRLLHKALRWELSTLQNGHTQADDEGDHQANSNGDAGDDMPIPAPAPSATLTLSWLALSPLEQNSETTLLRLCRAAFIKKLQADAMPDPEGFVELFQSAEDLVMTAEGYFPEEDGIFS